MIASKKTHFPFKRYLEALNFTFNWLENDPKKGPPARGGGILNSCSISDYDPKLAGPTGQKIKRLIDTSLPNEPEQLYTGAKAAFELFGDCELSRHLLRAAVKNNPVIIRKILGKADPPGIIWSNSVMNSH